MREESNPYEYVVIKQKYIETCQKIIKSSEGVYIYSMGRFPNIDNMMQVIDAYEAGLRDGRAEEHLNYAIDQIYDYVRNNA
jgi:hypothetical protein